ncbi:MAG: hypothetical protein IJ519_04750 [Clostridia bacterium]|nr:hypothetical protein [Clostridia bacterium]
MSEIRYLLRAKFNEFCIPDSVANSFLRSYRDAEDGVCPEILFREIPSDDCFKTLQSYYASVTETVIADDLLTYRLLSIPYGRVQAVKDILSEFLTADEIEKYYQRADIFFLAPESADEVIAFLFESGFTREELRAFVGDAVTIGQVSITRINGISALLGDERARRVICHAPVFYPYADPVGLIKFLRENGLTDDTVCRMMVDDPVLVMTFREDDSLESGHDQLYAMRAVIKAKAQND